MYEQEKQRVTHLIVLLCYTVLALGLTVESVLLGWDLGAVMLILAGLAACWVLHVTGKIPEDIRQWIYVVLTMLTFFFYGIHDTSIYDMATLMTVVIIMYISTEKYSIINLCMAAYYFTMFYDFMFVVGGSVEVDSLMISRTMLHLVLVYMAGRLSKIIIRRRRQERKKTNDIVAALEETNRRTEDFLTNVSHELRTPINVVTGLTAVMLKNETEEAKRKDILAVQMAGHRLFSQIEDILDYTEIDTGRIKVSEDAYMISSIVNDIISGIRMQERENAPELIFDIDAGIPSLLIGDGRKLKKILKHLVDNAMKFTKKGGVCVRIYALPKEYGINLCIRVSDTGIGMAEDNLLKIKESFYQLNGGRNRRAGGLGLGIPIVYGMAAAMEGFLQIESKEGSGTTVSVSIPQKVADASPCMSIANRERLCLGCYLRPEKYMVPEVRGYYDEVITHMIRGLDLVLHRVFNLEELEKLNSMYQLTHLFIGKEEYEEDREFFKGLDKSMEVVVIADDSLVLPKESHIKYIRKPFCCLPVISMLNAGPANNGNRFEKEYMICPEVRALVVDDEPVNLMVAEGILRDYQMQVKTAESGMKALELCDKEEFDLIFLDHMMPEMDGVETARVIRRLLGDNGQVPIIALTANAVEGTAQMFIDEGMNDFVTKPIEMRVILAKLRKWLPPEKIEKNRNKKMDAVLQGANKEGKPYQMSTDISIAGLDVKKAMEFLGNEELFWSVLKEYYRVIDKKSMMISEYEQKEMWKEYTVEVHALKSASRQIGALELAQVAEQMEAAGNAENAALIHKITPGMLEEYTFYKGILAPYFVKEKEAQSGRAAEASEMSELFGQMKEAMENLDMDAMEKVIKDMSQYSYSDEQYSIFEKLKNAVEDIDTEKCEEIIAEWKKELER